MAKGLHDFLALDHLVDQGSLLTAHGALALEILIAALGKEACHNQAQRGDADHHQRDGHILTEHKQQGAKDGQHAAEQLGKAHEQAVRKGVHIGDHAADDIAGGMAVEVGKRQGLNFAQGFVAQVAADKEGDAVVAHAQQPLRKGGDNSHHDDLVDDAQHAREVHGTFAQHHVDGTAAEDGDIQLGSHAHGGHDQAAHHKKSCRGGSFPAPAEALRCAVPGSAYSLLLHSFLRIPFLELALVDLLVDGAGLAQLVVGADAHQMAVVQHQNLIRVLQAGGALAHDEHGSGCRAEQPVPCAGRHRWRSPVRWRCRQGSEFPACPQGRGRWSGAASVRRTGCDRPVPQARPAQGAWL